ncbi:MAG: hypothetical protein K2X45_17545 [Phreatobacter sp.]|nr:hypothetical protein [Phreatobacter sp.]
MSAQDNAPDDWPQTRRCLLKAAAIGLSASFFGAGLAAYLNNKRHEEEAMHLNKRGFKSP